MFVVNRHGQREPVRFDKVLGRISALAEGLHPLVDPTKVAQAVINGMYSGISTSELDELSAQTCAYMAASHPDFSKLAARISVSNLHKNTSADFYKTAKMLYEYRDERGAKARLISRKVFKFIRLFKRELNEIIDYSRDFEFDYFAFKTLERSYLLRCKGKVVERPQHLFLRVACGIHYAECDGGRSRDTDPSCRTEGVCNDESLDVLSDTDIEEVMSEDDYCSECRPERRWREKPVEKKGSSEELSECLLRVRETYELMSRKYFTHATPTLFNSGTAKPQMSSCFLLQMEDDSINGIFNTLKKCALISKNAGGIGLAVHKIRGTGTYISGTNGHSNGIIPMIKVFNDTARYVDQGGGKRKGSFAMYLEPWHVDVFEFLDLKKNHGKEELRARDLFYALWIPDLFMERVQADGDWTLMCPRLCPGLPEAHGEEFNKLYTTYEKQGKGSRTIKAQQLWFAVLQSQIETGNPFMVYKDSCNRKSNQQNLGTIQCSNLCTEIVEYTAPDEIAVCNLASIALPRFVRTTYQGQPLTHTTPLLKVALPQHKDQPTSVDNVAHNNVSDNVRSGPESVRSDNVGADNLNHHNLGHDNDVVVSHVVSDRGEGRGGQCLSKCTVEPLSARLDTICATPSPICTYYDFEHLYRVTKVVTRNLNKVIDRNHYPVPATRRSNLRHRPIGIGVQGFADALMLLRLPYESPEAADLNRKIFETIYFAACEASAELAEQHGPYETFPGSPASQGKLQFDLWNDERKLKATLAGGAMADDVVFETVKLSGMWNWDALKDRIRATGLRNSLLVAPMPTASTSQILGNCESFEPYTSNIYTRRVLSGEFFVVNPHLLRDLIERNYWNETMKQRLIAANGSVQQIPDIPDELKSIYKAVWEIKQRSLIDLAAGRGPFIDQSQSLNLYVTNPTFAKLSSMHFYGWKAGLKTGMYYLRTQSAVDAIKFTVDRATVAAAKQRQQEAKMGREVTTTASEDAENVPVSSAACPRRRAEDEICHVCSA